MHHRLDELTDTMAEGFDLPADLVGPFRDVLAHFDPGRLVHALAVLDDAAVGCGSLLLSGRYNVATELGESVYPRLGFEPICTIREFLWTPG